MTVGRNDWSNVSSIAQRVESDAIFIVREVNYIEPLITTFRDMQGMNLRRGYAYNNATANVVGDADDLASQTFTPSADQTLTPYEIGAQFFITDARMESELPENIMTDAASELGLAAADKVMTDICTEFASLTGGTVGAAGSAITWSYMAAAIAQARNVNKSANKPLAAVIHGYQANVLAKAASIAGATQLTSAPGYTEAVTRDGTGVMPVFSFMGVPIYQVFQTPDGNDDFTGGVFPREAIAIDWRRQVRVVPQRDESRRGLELNMSAIYDVGVWRPARGIKIIFDATAPTGA